MLSANTAGFPGACKRTIGALAGPECTLGKYNNEGPDREPTAMRAARCGGGSIGLLQAARSLAREWRTRRSRVDAVGLGRTLSESAPSRILFFGAMRVRGGLLRNFRVRFRSAFRSALGLVRIGLFAPAHRHAGGSRRVGPGSRLRGQARCGAERVVSANTRSPAGQSPNAKWASAM